MELVVILTAWAVVAGVYFLPCLIAGARNHPQGGPILIVNLFLGWTLIGWVAALAWACSRFTTSQPSGALPQA